MPILFGIVYYLCIATGLNDTADLVFTCFAAWVVLKVLP